ncbi:cytochrome d ubiquinol oxidase subunit II [Alicyclobacillus sp. SO9]|uniref:cytochrome d ubiquinol oxidase subunit II n=1 Tax=Alicyclobacillus sp. SO9 TaxID=2665646 RepID=UPI0018E6E57C|nr:cytochrome d ubiquinol oxidase subunit II [Alicyclobacillus sp. SO9]QQE77699.1 cytochrome d ubiquinol oxidase subunit II [Alicyclobacillus sp. SO9]
MTLNALWFIIIGLLFTGFFFLEGFDFGVGILVPLLGRNDTERRVLINSIGPFWDANEVWLIAAGASMFAAFPNWYATLFSGFYIALFLMLLALIGRGVAFEYRSKIEQPKWRKFWDWVIFAGSLIPPLLWGVALADLMKGVPIDGHMNYVGTFFDLLSWYSVLGGLSVVLLFVLHGALFITLRTAEDIRDRARNVAMKTGGLTTFILFAFVVATYIETDIFTKIGVDPGSIPIVAGLALVSVRFLVQAKHYAWAFAMTGITIILSTMTVFVGLYPRVMISSLNANWSLTVFNASSNTYSLQVMTVVALTIVPFVVAYQIWSYWVFRKRVKLDHLDY